MKLNKKNIHIILLILIVFTTFLAYSNTLKNSFVWDDPEFILEWYEIRSLKNIPSFFKGAVPFEHSGVYRPIRSVFYSISYKLWGVNPSGYKFQAISIHLLCTILVYLIAFQLTSKIGVAFMSSVLFGTHPIHTEAINLVAASFDVIGIIFVLASFYMYLRAQASPKRHHLYLTASVILAWVSFFSYEFGLTLPFMILLHDICFKRIKVHKDKRQNSLDAENKASFAKPNGNVLRKLKEYSFYLIGAFVYLSIRVFALKIGSRGSYLAGSFYLTMITMAKAFFKYILLLIFPINLSVNHTIPGGILSLVYLDFNEKAILAQSIFDLNTLLPIAAILFLIILALKGIKNYPLASFCIGWFFIGLSPVSNIIPQAAILSEKYLYLSSFAYCLLLSFIFYCFYNLAKRNKIKPVKVLLALSFVFIILSYSFLTYSRNKDFRDSLALWSKTVEQAPGSVIAHDNLGMAYHNMGDLDNAVREFKAALAIKSDHHKAYSNLGVSYYELGDLDSAITAYNSAISINPNDAKAHNNLGAAYYKKGYTDLAIEEYKIASSINPNYIHAIFNLGNTYYHAKKEIDLAIAEYEKVLAIDPKNEIARKNLKKALNRTAYNKRHQ
ncbi:tetratricopeptide repeat protein [Candidatus Woesearchaeota archaeon]|nr:tetratricopeptide repeat protein [Candidatus Woesearchaeota archaeon]